MDTEPDVPSLDVPVFSTSVPLVPSYPAFAVAIAIRPLVLSTDVPLVMNTEPPVDSSAVVMPAVITTSEPHPLSPIPTTNVTAPPRPLVASPLEIVTEPEFPSLDAPVNKDTDPLTP
jgi:hypothetical protein